MTAFDPSQQRVLALDPRRHARVLGAPGTGKSVLLVESFARAIEWDGWSENDVLVLAPSRLAASGLRSAVERRVSRAIGGSPVRTASSLAFSLLSRRAAQDGTPPPRLLTGTVQDEIIAEVVRERLERTGSDAVGEIPGFAAEVLLSAPFRAELRELWRVLDDFAVEPADLAARLAEISRVSGESAFTAAPDETLQDRWIGGLSLLAEARERAAAARPGELSSSAMLRNAAAAIRMGGSQPPRLLLVDDAQDLGEGQLALLAACADAGSAIWAFGDPDIATGAFQGERTRVLAGIGAELRRVGAALRGGGAGQYGPGWIASPEEERAEEQLVVLETVHRHGTALRELARALSVRIGSMGAGAQRSASAADRPDGPEQLGFAKVGSPSEQIGVIAHRMRSRKLGLSGGAPLGWGEMAVLCRTRAEAVRAARLLAAHQVPTGVAAGGIVLREFQIVRELIVLLQHVRATETLDAAGVLRLLGGVIGGLDPVAVRRLRGALLVQERRAARDEEREPDSVEELVLDAFRFPGSEAVIDSAGGRALRRIGRIAGEAAKVHAAGGTPREVLWALWDGTRLAERWQRDALSGRGLRADEANRSLDAVMGLFFVLQRHEEQDSEQDVDELLSELLRSTVPEDSLAQRSERETVTVTTPQGVVGREFELVAVIGVQDGSWPNLKARGSLLGTAALERWLRGGEALPPSRRDTLHDELRLFLHACTRARGELLVAAIADDEHHPSPFFGFGELHRVDSLPSTRLTLRGATAEMRRRIVADPGDETALRSLAALAEAGVPGANPEDWYGVLEPSTTEPLYSATSGNPTGDDEQDDRAAEPVPVSPSQLERAENCSLDWVISALGGGSGSVQASLGTLVHHALETAEGSDPEALLAAITAEWSKLPFDAEWESERALGVAASMASGLADYLGAFEASGRELLGRETSFSLDMGRARLRGIADRIELARTPGGAEITVVDLKTGRAPATAKETEEHVQLQAYQLGAALGAFDLVDDAVAPPQARTAAKLLYVHPDAARGRGYVERAQSELGEEARRLLEERVTAVADAMAAGEFIARVEHHCSDTRQPGNCRLHIIQAVSHA